MKRSLYLNNLISDRSLATGTATADADHEWLDKLTLAVIPALETEIIEFTTS